MSSYERNTETEGCTGWCTTYCTHHQVANPVGSSQMKIDQEQHEPENSDAKEIMEKENQRNASKAEKVIHWALQDKKARASDVEVQNRRSTLRARGTQESDAKVAELNRRLQKEKAKGSKVEEAARRQKQEAEAKVAGLSQRLREEMEASRRKQTELSQRLREETEVSRRKEKEMKRQEAKGVEVTEASRRKERDLKAQNAEIKRRLHEKTVKLSKLEAEVARQNARKERESKRFVAELQLRFQGKTVKLSNIEASRRNSTKGESSEPGQEGKVAELEAKLAGMEDDARRWEQTNRDLSAKNQEQSDEINQLKARVKTLFEQANKPPKKVLVRKPDSISMVEAEELIRFLNAQIEQLCNRIVDSVSSRESPSSGAGSAALNDLRDYLGPWLFNALLRRLHESNPLIPQVALQTVLAQACSRIINHWNPPFWNDDSISFRVYSNMVQAGPMVAGTWSALPRTMSQSEVQKANVEYLSEILVKVIAVVGGPLPNGEIFPPEYQDDVEGIAKRALEFRQIVGKDVKSMDLVTFTIPSDTPFNPSQMIDTEGSVDGTGCVRDDKVICALEMGLQYRKRAELGKPGGGQCGVILKPKVVLPAVLEA